MSRPQVTCVAILIILMVSIAVASVHPTGNHQHTASGTPSPAFNAQPSSTNTTVYITPSNVTQLNLSGHFTFGVYVNNTPAINLYIVSIQYNSTLLKVVNVNSTGDLLGTDAQPYLYCIDGINQANINAQCLTFNGYTIDQPGVVTFGESLLGGLSQPTQNGLLFNITFNVVGTGLEQLHVLYFTLANGSNEVPAVSQDAFIANGNCGASLCKAPSINLTSTPAKFSVGSVGTLNATVALRSMNAKVVSFLWSFGEVCASCGQEYTTTNGTTPFAQHAYQNTGLYLTSVQAVIGNSSNTLGRYRFYWSATLVVNVTRLYVSLYVGEITAKPQVKVVPGTLVDIHAVINNNSTINEDTTFSITIERTTVLKVSPVVTLSTRGQTSLDVVWNTSGYTPRAYQIVVIIPPVAHENSTSGNSGSLYVFLISQAPSGLLSLSLLQTTGLSIVILLGIGVGLSRFLRKPSYESEPL